MKQITFSISGLLLMLNVFSQDYVELSKDFLEALKSGKNSDKYVRQIANIDPDNLNKQIDTQEEKLAFWINIYNGFIQYKLQKNPKLYEDRGDFFRNKILTIAGEKVSFDNIEHGILRKGISKYSAGYFKNPFNSSWARRYQVERINWRIHFALNCGAHSCPLIQIYDDKTIYKQLNASSKLYLKSQVHYDKKQKEIHIPILMNWFRGDFGGLKGVKKILKINGFIPEGQNPDIKFNDYNWDLKLGTFHDT